MLKNQQKKSQETSLEILKKILDKKAQKMKGKKKGRVYPCFSSSSSSIASFRDPNSVFKLLPVKILALASALPPQDQEVLAYMITRSIFSTINPSIIINHRPKNKFKKGKVDPVFQCGCFHCYTRFWHRWDCSPNRDLIDQIIEAFEDHLVQNEGSKKHCKSGSRKKNKVIVSICESNVVSVDDDALRGEQSQESEILMVENEGLADAPESGGGSEQEEDVEMDILAAATGVSHRHNQKGLARKVISDMVGLLNSRLWSLWGPSI